MLYIFFDLHSTACMGGLCASQPKLHRPFFLLLPSFSQERFVCAELVICVVGPAFLPRLFNETVCLLFQVRLRDFKTIIKMEELRTSSLCMTFSPNLYSTGFETLIYHSISSIYQKKFHQIPDDEFCVYHYQIYQRTAQMLIRERYSDCYAIVKIVDKFQRNVTYIRAINVKIQSYHKRNNTSVIMQSYKNVIIQLYNKLHNIII